MTPTNPIGKIFVVGIISIFQFSPLLAQEAAPNNPPLKFDILNTNVDRTGLTTGSIMSDSKLLSYCINISDLATETRSSILTKRLLEIEEKTDEKLTKLSEKIEELKMWTEKRESFLNNVNLSLLKIYGSMRPDAAALQLTEIGPVVASAIILKLDPKISSAILSEMKPIDAAKISLILTSSKEKNHVPTN